MLWAVDPVTKGVTLVPVSQRMRRLANVRLVFVRTACTESVVRESKLQLCSSADTQVFRILSF